MTTTTTTTNDSSRVSIPNNIRKLIQQVIKKTSSNHTDEFIHTILKESKLDVNESVKKLKMIHDVQEIAGKHSVDDVYLMLKECGMDPNEAAQRLLYIDTFHEVKKKSDRRKSISSDEYEDYGRGRVNQWRGPRGGGRGTFHLSKVYNDAGGGRNLISEKEYGVTNHVKRVSRSTLPVDSRKENNVLHVANSAANTNGKPALSNGSHSHKLAPKISLDVSSSTSDTDAVSYQNTKYTCSVGTIKCEIVKHETCSKSNAGATGGKKFSADPVSSGTISVIAEAASDVVEKNQVSKSLLPTQNSSHVVNPAQDNQPPQLLVESSKVSASEHSTESTTNTRSVSDEESELKVSSHKLDVMLEKLPISSCQPVVIFPDLQVPENYKSHFVFGSLDATSDDARPLSVTESTHQNDDAVSEPSLSDQNVPTTAQEGEPENHQLPDISEHVLLPSQDNISSDSALKHVQAEQEMIPPVGAFQNHVLQTTRGYNFGFIPHPMGPHLVQLEAPELQSVSSQVASTLGPTPATQPAMTGQTSIAMAPPLFPYYTRQPYPYIPYNPYFHPMYVPHNAHLLNHGVYPQQPPTVNVHMQPGVKLPAPSQLKEGSDEDHNASEAKYNNGHSTSQQGEEPQVWPPATGWDMPNILPHYFYNFPQAQHMAFSPLQAAPYHPSQTMPAQPTIQPPLLYQPQSTGGTGDPMVQPPPLTKPQQAAQIHWDSALLDRETS